MEPKDDGLPFLEKLGISAGKASGKMQSFWCGDYFHQPTSRVEIYPKDMVKLLVFVFLGDFGVRGLVFGRHGF